MDKSRRHHNHHHNHHGDDHQQHWQHQHQHKEELANTHHKEWLKEHREARAREGRIVRVFIAVRGGTVWGTRRIKPPSALKRGMNRIKILSSTQLQEREMKRTRAVALTTIVLVVIAVVVTGCFFLMVGH